MKSCEIISGGKGSGKTTFLLSLFPEAKGFVTIHKGDEYFLYSLETKKEELLLSRTFPFPHTWNGWRVNEELFQKANATLSQYTSGIVVVDEVGMMEVEGRGFSPFLKKAPSLGIDLKLCVRDSFIPMVEKEFLSSTSFSVRMVDRA